MGSSSRQQQVVSAEVVVSEAKVDEEENVEEECLCFFGKTTSVGIYYVFLDHCQLSSNDYAVKRSVMKFARLDGSVPIVLTCFKHNEKRGRHRWKVYADTFRSHVSEEINQFIG